MKSFIAFSLKDPDTARAEFGLELVSKGEPERGKVRTAWKIFPAGESDDE
jgi:hypothetical protein